MRFILVFILLIPIPFSCDLFVPCNCPASKLYELDEFVAGYVDGTKFSDPDDTTFIAELRIVVEFSTERQRSENVKPGSLYSSAYACDCIGDYIEANFTEFTLTSTAAFGEDFPAGTDLSSLFTTDLAYYHYPDEPIYNLWIDPAPEIDSVHVFHVYLEQENGRVFAFDTKPIQIMK